MNGTNEHEAQAAKFLDGHGLKMRAVRHGDKCPPWGRDGGRRFGDECSECGGVHGERCRITIWRDGVSGRLSFDYWTSHNDARTHKTPTAYDVLSCISGDVYTPATFADFCGEYGYEEDSRSAFAAFKRCDRFARRARAFFTEAEQAELVEIQ